MKIKKLYPDVELPKYETEGAAGFDFRAYMPGREVVIPPSTVEYDEFLAQDVVTPGRGLIPTGLAFAIPKGFELQVRSRSGLALKKGIQAHFGTIDADYRGEVGVILFNFGEEPLTIEHGDRIAQGIVAAVARMPFEEVTELDETERGTGGFGSTGTN